MPTADASPEVTHDGLQFWQYMVSGSIAGSLEHMAMFPVDTLKTRMQVINGLNPAHHGGVRRALGSIPKLEGPSGLYRGIAAMGLGAGPAHAVYFSVYEICKEKFSRGNPNNPTAHAAFRNLRHHRERRRDDANDVVKQRLQLKSSPYNGVWDCAKRVLKEEGVGALYASYRTTVVMNAPFTAVHFAMYEAAKRGLTELSPVNSEGGRVAVHAAAGAVSGVVAGAVTTPLDVVKTQLQCQGVCGCDKFCDSLMGQVIETVVKKEGYRGLMRGYIPRMLFHAPAAAICWSSYEASKSFFLRL